MPLSNDDKRLRARGVTATDLVRIMDGGSTSVWLEKRGLVEVMDTPRMKAGRKLERAIAEWAGEEMGVHVRPSWGTLMHERHPWALATPDYFATLPCNTSLQQGMLAPLECKNVGGHRAHEFDNGLPERVLVQVSWQMFVTDLPRAVVAALINGWDLRIVPVERDRELEASLAKIAEIWHRRYIVGGEQPEADGSALFAKYLNEAFPRANGKTIVSDVKTAATVARIEEARRSEKAARVLGAALSQEVRAFMGAAEFMTLPGGRTVRLSDVKGSTYTVNRKPGRRLYLPDAEEE